MCADLRRALKRQETGPLVVSIVVVYSFSEVHARRTDSKVGSATEGCEAMGIPGKVEKGGKK
jgi:hypothetical protein